MKITSQEEYGLRCLLHLARAEAGEALTIQEIASAEGLSVPNVAKLLSILRQGGLIDSERGRSGGYRLAGSPVDITIGKVMRVLGEPLYDETSYCQRHAGTEANGSCVHQTGCTLRDLWQTLEQWMRHTLDQITLHDLTHGEGQLADLLRTRLAEAVLEPAHVLIPLTTLD